MQKHLGNLLFKARVALQVSTDSLAHHGVLAHEYDGMTPEGHTDLLHLFGSDIVSFDLKA